MFKTMNRNWGGKVIDNSYCFSAFSPCYGGSPVAQTVKNLPAVQAGFDPWVGKIPWRRKWQPTPVFLPGESHRQKSLAGYNPRGCKESDTTE